MISSDDIDRGSPVTKWWCSAVRRGPICANGFALHGLACTPANEAMAAEWVPPCCSDDLVVRRASGKPPTPPFLKQYAAPDDIG